MTQKFWVILYWFSTPPQDCPKSPRETEILCTPIQGQKRFSIPTEEYLTFQIAPTDSSATHIRGQWGKPCVQESRRQRLISWMRSS